MPKNISTIRQFDGTSRQAPDDTVNKFSSYAAVGTVGETGCVLGSARKEGWIRS